MNRTTIWHNQKCSKSREAMEILTKNESKIDVVNYLEATPSKEEIKRVLKMLSIEPRELMRTKEDIYKELNLKEIHDEEALIEAMSKHPNLIERPVIIKGDKAIIGRPTEIIEAFLNE